MFSPSIPLTSLRPMPPIPMQATLSLSLGATKPRPSTCRGTMVKAAAAAVSRTKLRRLIRFFPIRCPPYGFSLRGCLRVTALRTEQQREHHEDRERAECGVQPDGGPVMRPGDAPIRRACRRTREMAHHRARDQCSDEVTHAVRDEVDESLGGGADLRPGLLVGVDLAAHEKEVVAHAVQQNAGVDQPHPRTGVAMPERQVPQPPGEHPRQHDHLYPI